MIKINAAARLRASNSFLDSHDARDTSKEIMTAIYDLAHHSDHAAEQIWEDPTHSQLMAVQKAVTRNGKRPTDFFWGAAGKHWA